MPESALQTLTCGPLDATFEDALMSVQNYGFIQAVFEVERLNAPGGKATKAAPGKLTVLRPSSTQAHYPAIKPGDKVHCPGLGSDGEGVVALYRVRRMAEGFGRRKMTVWPEA